MGASSRWRAAALTLILLAVTFAGCLSNQGSTNSDSSGSFDAPARPAFEKGRAVVAVLDTGANPYHADFSRPSRPSAAQSIPGYPDNVRSLELTLDAPSYQDALAADAELWDAVRMGTLYDVPGTALVGFIAFSQPAPHEDAPRRAPGLDEDGHGTAALGAAIQACPDCLFVAVETAGAVEANAALAWVRQQTWIDIIAYPARAGTGFAGAGVYAAGDQTFAWARPNVESGQVVVVAAGNGEPGGAPRGLASAYTPARDLSYSYWTAGPDWVVTVGASDPQTKGASTWHTYPVDIIAPGTGCTVPHPFHRQDHVLFSGTSCSAPIVAGQVGSVLAHARELVHDGATGPRSGQRLVVPEDVRAPTTTREDLTRAFLLTAGPAGRGTIPVEFQDPSDPSTWTHGGQILGPVHAGWGVHTSSTLAHAAQVLAGREPAPAPSAEEATWFAIDRRLRLDLWGGWDDGASSIPFPAPLAEPVRAPETPAQAMSLYAAAQERAGRV